jgi:hypothetical protein
MERRERGYRRSEMQSHDDDDDLRGELGQTLTLFGMGLAVVIAGLLIGLGL